MKIHSIKLLFFITVALSLFACNINSDNPGNEGRLRTENFNLRKENDSLKKIISSDSIRSAAEIRRDSAVNPADINSVGTFIGKHALTLQWISWDNPGSVMIGPAESGWYVISGEQKNSKGDYLKISGRIRKLFDKELEFEGSIETRVGHINNGQPCIKTGKQTFLATGTRQYWRLQNMLNCEGNRVVDYVDIYFNN